MTMFNIIREEIEFGSGRQLILETGRIARQAHGAVLATYGETSVLAAVTVAREPKPDLGFFPLTVNYVEKAYAAGKVPGGYFKREGRPSEKETLVSRLIDRPIRPLFDKNFKNETQIVATVLSHDLENDSDIIAMIATSAALAVSGIPFAGPIGAARVGYINNDYVLNPLSPQMGESKLDLVAAGTSDAILMVESQAQELSEEIMLGAVMFAQRGWQLVINGITRMAEKAARPKMQVPADAMPDNLSGDVAAAFESDFVQAYQISEKTARQNKLDELRQNAAEKFTAENDMTGQVSSIVKKLESKILRGDILAGKKRIDGRAVDDIRPIEAEVGVLPRTHGSALFTRGETQALVVATLGTGEDEQFVDALEGTYRERFMLHYNFPPYSVGEVGRVGFTSRRETGHGKLAWRALRAALPEAESFPYTLRLVSEIMESNGSSSMATVCGASLALMDAGVPLSAPVAGIAMGLIKEGEKFAVLSDILGDEDHLGDMDFKVAGTSQGITALQMDIKITGITENIMKQALAQAQTGRAHILAEMAKALGQAREEVGEYAPRVETIKISPDKIREVIGTGGKVVREIVETTGAKVDIEDNGTIKVSSSNSESIRRAVDWINSIAAEPEAGELYEGTVVKTLDFGAFVNFFGKRDGLVHISQLSEGRVGKVEDVVREGDRVRVKCVGFDDRGKVRLTMRGVDQENLSK